jgi:hypothetical protein
MAAQKTQPWYVGKRAEAFVYSLLAGHNVAVQGQDTQNLGVDFLIDLRQGERELGRYLAVQLLPYVSFPSEAELRKEVRKRFPRKLREEFSLPLAVFAVQVKELAAVYAWVIEPSVEQGEAILRSGEYSWERLDDRAMEEILARVDTFWNVLMKKAKRA